MATRAALAVGFIRSRRPIRRIETSSRSYAKWMQNQKTVISSSSEAENSWRNFRNSSSNDGNDGEKYRVAKMAAGLALASGSIFAIRSYYDEIDRYFKSKLHVNAARKKKVSAGF